MDIGGDTNQAHSKDRYLTHSNLRLRHVEENGKPPVFKIGQKIRLPGSLPPPFARASIYVERDEFDNLSSLAGDNLMKIRQIYSDNGNFVKSIASISRYRTLLERALPS